MTVLINEPLQEIEDVDDEPLIAAHIHEDAKLDSKPCTAHKQLDTEPAKSEPEQIAEPVVSAPEEINEGASSKNITASHEVTDAETQIALQVESSVPSRPAGLVCQYELERLQRIQTNAQMMQTLGLRSHQCTGADMWQSEATSLRLLLRYPLLYPLRYPRHYALCWCTLQSS